MPSAKLLTLKLDYNSNIGSDGCRMLCGGLKNSLTLKQLHMQFCSIQSGGGGPLADLISGTFGAKLEKLNIKGNKLGCDGLAKMCMGLEKSTSLTYLNISDNSIVEDAECMDLLGAALAKNFSMSEQSLAHLDMSFNAIGVDGANALIPYMEGIPKDRLKATKVDENLPTALFEKLSRIEAGGKKAKKGKKGKKKKK